MYVEMGSFIDQRCEKIDEAFRIPILRLAVLADEPRAAIEIPADDEDRRACLDKRLAQRAEVACRVDQDSGPFGSLETPDVAIRGEDHAGAHGCWAGPLGPPII